MPFKVVLVMNMLSGPETNPSNIFLSLYFAGYHSQSVFYSGKHDSQK